MILRIKELSKEHSTECNSLIIILDKISYSQIFIYSDEDTLNRLLLKTEMIGGKCITSFY